MTPDVVSHQFKHKQSKSKHKQGFECKRSVVSENITS